MLCRGLSFLALTVQLNFLIFLEERQPSLLVLSLPAAFWPSVCKGNFRNLQTIHPCSYAFLEPDTQHRYAQMQSKTYSMR